MTGILARVMHRACSRSSTVIPNGALETLVRRDLNGTQAPQRARSCEHRAPEAHRSATVYPKPYGQPSTNRLKEPLGPVLSGS
jgi:hypothetical protein